jgi:hypothetical protein
MPTNEDFFQVFGHISIFFATWDFFVSTIITRVAGPDCKLSNLYGATLGRKLQYLKSLKPEQSLNGPVLRQIQSALPMAIEISNQRNRFIHDQWVFNPDKIKHGLIDRLTLKSCEVAGSITFSSDTETHSLVDLYEFLGKIGEQQKVFGELLNQIGK